MTIEQTVADVAQAATWDDRVAAIRRVPEVYGQAHHREVYAAIASEAYRPQLTPDFSHIHWREDYELAAFEEAYDQTSRATGDFTDVDVSTLSRTLRRHPRTALVLRTIVGYTQPELAASTKLLPELYGIQPVSSSRLKSMESGTEQDMAYCRAIAEVVLRLMDGRLFPDDPASPTRRKQDKPDTADGWATVQRLARDGVPYSWLLHQRQYGGAFRQLLDATSTQRGDVIEDAVEELLADAGVPFVRTGAHNQAEIAERFGLTVQPAPDFVFHDLADTLKGLLEAKGTNDGGTARDKAARFRALRTEGSRLGGVPVFAVLAGTGWARVRDALGPVVQACDGRVFTPATLSDLLTVQPLPSLRGLTPAPGEAT